jgi:hypothetical protein
LIHLRQRVAAGDQVDGPAIAPVVVVGARAVALALSLPWLYGFGSQALRVFQAPLRRGKWLPSLPPPANRWTMVRPMPAYNAGFRQWWRARTPETLAASRRRILAGVFAAGLAAAALRWWIIGRRR